MIVPNKYIRECDTLIGVGSVILNNLSSGRALSELWENVKDVSSVGTYERFVLGLDLLFVLGLVEIVNDRIMKVKL